MGILESYITVHDLNKFISTVLCLVYNSIKLFYTHLNVIIWETEISADIHLKSENMLHAFKEGMF